MIVITAASGQLGQILADELATRGLAGKVRLAARAPDKLGARKAQGFEVARADYDDPASLRAAFEGADTVLMISSNTGNDMRTRQQLGAIDVAKQAGVSRVVYTSAVNPVSGSLFGWAKSHAATETALKGSGLAYTILRDNSYFENNAPLFANAKESGVLPFTGINAKVAYVTRHDVAGALAGALTGSGRDGKTYEIAGDNAYSAVELAAILAGVTGRAIKALDVPVQAFEDQFRAMGLPDEVAAGVASFYAALGAGEYAATSKDVERLSGRPTTTAQDYLKAFA